MSNISFDNVYLLFLIIPLVAVFAIPFALAVRKDNVNGHNIASGVLHIIIAVIVSFAIAGTTVNSVMTATEVYVVVDASYSTHRNTDVIDGYIQNVRDELPANSRMGIVAFGRDYQLLTPIGGSVKSIRSATVDESATNIAGALTYTSGLFSEGVIKRIVLITDGTESDPNGFGNLSGVVNSLYEDNIYVDAIYVDDNMVYGDSSVTEIQITSVDCGQTVFLNRPAAADVVIQSGSAVNAIISLTSVDENGTEKQIDSHAEQLSQGSNFFSFDLDTSQAGSFTYTVSVRAAGGEEELNNTNNSLTFKQTVTEQLNILLVAGSTQNRDAVLDIYQAKYGELERHTDNNKLYSNDNILLDYRNVSPDNTLRDVPVTVEELVAYDEIVLAGTDIRNIPNYTGFVDAIDTVVSQFGKSLFTFGNLQIQNVPVLGDDEQTDPGVQAGYQALNDLGDMLPVRFSSADKDARYMVFVIDNSRSMQELGQMNRIKQIVTQILYMLEDTDYVSVISFWGDNIQVWPGTAPLGNNREEIISRVDALTLQQGTNIQAALNRAYDDCRANSDVFSSMDVWLISDGNTWVNGGSSADFGFVGDAYDDGIYTSCVYTGTTAISDGNVEPAGKVNMQEIAREGRGNKGTASNYYIINNTGALDEVLFGELADHISQKRIDKASAVHVNVANDESVAIENIGLPSVSGYYYSSQKASASTVLTVDYSRESGSTVQAPLYAHWNYGSGRVYTFTASLSDSDSSGNLFSDLTSWFSDDTAMQVLSNAVFSATPSSRVDHPFSFTTDYDQGYVSLEVAPSRLSASATATATITRLGSDSQQEEVQNVVLSFNSQTYTYGFLADKIGSYRIDVTYTSGNNSYSATSYFSVDYLPEYNEFATYSAATLNRLLAGRGQVSENGELTIENDPDMLTTYTVSLTMPLLIVAVVLYVADIIIRKLKWNDIKSLFVKIK